ncbi:NADPH-dependent F420 reductase [Kitasatospora sp. NPDC096147]|uniref:NADPH-dependent F420 reductase n=1 Tax=Kitasatospora sp. NPDC096147 TaxID=3364093 RepID=UPI00381055A9
MRINVIGTGNAGSVLARRLAGAGHLVTTANTATPVADAARQAAEAEVTFLAVPFTATLAPEVRAALAGRIVVDATNPLSADFLSLTVGHTTSGGELTAEALPGARVVKGFNTVLAAATQAGSYQGRPLLLLLAGDDREAVRTVAGIGASLGLDPVDAGPLAVARYLEPLAEVLIHLAYAQGLGPEIGLALLRAADPQ